LPNSHYQCNAVLLAFVSRWFACVQEAQQKESQWQSTEGAQPIQVPKSVTQAQLSAYLACVHRTTALSVDTVCDVADAAHYFDDSGTLLQCNALLQRESDLKTLQASQARYLLLAIRCKLACAANLATLVRSRWQQFWADKAQGGGREQCTLAWPQLTVDFQLQLLADQTESNARLRQDVEECEQCANQCVQRLETLMRDVWPLLPDDDAGRGGPFKKIRCRQVFNQIMEEMSW